MAEKRDVQVIIDDKVITLSAEESVEYVQSVALYINGKINELHMSDGYKRLPDDYRTLMLNLNIADDYFKAKEKVDKLEATVKKLEKENYDIQHEQIETKIKYESALKMQEEYKAQLLATQNRVLELEALKKTKTTKTADAKTTVKPAETKAAAKPTGTVGTQTTLPNL